MHMNSVGLDMVWVLRFDKEISITLQLRAEHTLQAAIVLGSLHCSAAEHMYIQHCTDEKPNNSTTPYACRQSSIRPC
jgi:hypothetical protein